MKSYQITCNIDYWPHSNEAAKMAYSIKKVINAISNEAAITELDRLVLKADDELVMRGFQVEHRDWAVDEI